MKKSAEATQSAAKTTSTTSSQSAAPVVVIATPHKQQTAKEAIAANVQLLIEQLGVNPTLL